VSKSSGEAMRISYTEATLDARGEFRRLRAMAGAMTPEVREEIDRLVDVLTDAYKRVDGMVDDESYMAAREGFRDEIEKLEGEVTEKEKEIDVLNERVEEYQQILKGSEDATQMKLAELLQKQETHERDLQRMHNKARQADERARDAELRASTATAQLAANQIRMAAWSSDKTAVETADHYRERANAVSDELTALRKNVREALDVTAAHTKSKVRREAIREVGDLIDALNRKSMAFPKVSP
jgi:chromosome segregation ATPase